MPYFSSQRVPIALLLGAVLLGALTLGILAARHRSASRPMMDAVQRDVDALESDSLPVLGQVPDFTLTDQRNQPFGSAELRGKIWIANFIFTRCSGPCPVMTHRTSLLQRELANWPQWRDIRLVSFSVDPTHDTPDVLAGFARRHDADDQQWRFLTGPRDAIWQLSQEGFYLGVGDNPGDVNMPIFHSQKSALVDDLGRLRGHYNILLRDEREQLLRDLPILLQEMRHCADQPAAPTAAPLP
jgi:protein SCO1/2